ncbi:helix-turn-helix domain-containing protein [Streptomyces sp. NPDC050400]|uniref:helix-turn-helix domain-containing protein n=1 Tax=Streptomyces sp. NPDC050400 TaxID=3365610 RepID=UPI00379164B0
MATDFADALQRLMEERHLTPRSVSTASGLAESTVRRLLTGQIQPTAELVDRIGPAHRGAPCRASRIRRRGHCGGSRTSVTPLPEGLHQSPFPYP